MVLAQTYSSPIQASVTAFGVRRDASISAAFIPDLRDRRPRAAIVHRSTGPFRLRMLLPARCEYCIRTPSGGGGARCTVRQSDPENLQFSLP